METKKSKNKVIINNHQELEALIKDGVINIKGDLEINCHVRVFADLYADNIKAKDLSVFKIDANDIIAERIHCTDIKARNITAREIKAISDINAREITARDIKADDIKAKSIDAENIDYYAFCVAYDFIRCHNINGALKNSFHKVVLNDKGVEYKHKFICKCGTIRE